MIGQVVTDPDTGLPIGNNGNALSESAYNPPQEVKDLFARVQKDFQSAWALTRRPLDEFDGYSLLQRTKLDQETFAAFVGLEYQPKHKRWRWKGRKNTARNKLIGILAHMIAGMLFPYVFAQNDQDEEDKMTARVMKILVEEKLKAAKYELKFFYSVLTALVNPAVFIEVEYIEELITIRQRMADGTMTAKQVIDEAMTRLFLHIVPIDEILLGDFWSGTGEIQQLPYMVRMRRISYDTASARYRGRYYYNGADVFDYVHAGQTKWMMTNDKGEQTLMDIDDTEVEPNFVLEVTIKYRKDDLELTWVGGVGMFDHLHPYDSPIKHRRMVMDKQNNWFTIPMYNIAMSGFEPIDPQGRFAWYKSGAFKEYWEDLKITELDRLLIDGVKLDVFKPMFLAGVAKIDQSVMAPGTTVTMPQGATATPYSLSPNLASAYQAITGAAEDMSESTQDKVMQGATDSGVTATQTIEARKNAQVFLGVFGFMIAQLIKQVGELVVDITIMYDTVGDIDAYTSGTLRATYRNVLARSKEKGQDVTHRIVFTDQYMGRKLTDERKTQIEWGLYEKAGGNDSNQRIWLINPYRFARTRYSMFIDADQIVSKSMGNDRMEKDLAFQKLMDPRVMPFIDPETVVDDFVIDEYANGDPDRYKKKQGQDELIQALMSQAQPGAGQPTQQTPNPMQGQ